MKSTGIVQVDTVRPTITNKHNIHQQLLLKNCYSTWLPRHCLCTRTHHI